MPSKSRIAALAAFAALSAAGWAEAGTLGDAGSYNNPYGMTSSQENQAINPSMRDANGNLEMVNGQILTGTVSMQSGVGATNTTGGSGALYGGATAIGNSLNVVTNGSNNTVIVTANQKNSGDVTATVTTNGQ